MFNAFLKVPSTIASKYIQSVKAVCQSVFIRKLVSTLEQLKCIIIYVVHLFAGISNICNVKSTILYGRYEFYIKKA